MSTFDVVLREGPVERLVTIDAGSKREVEGKLRGFFARDGVLDIVRITKQPHTKAVKTLPKHIADYVERL